MLFSCKSAKCNNVTEVEAEVEEILSDSFRGVAPEVSRRLESVTA